MGSKFFNLVGGSLEFQSSKLIISDKEKSRRNLWLISTICTLIIGLALIVSGRRDQELFIFCLGLMILLMELIIIYIGVRKNQFRRVDDRIPLDKIRSATLKPNFYGDTIMVKLFTPKNGVREFQLVNENNQFADFKELLLEHHIKFSEAESSN